MLIILYLLLFLELTGVQARTPSQLYGRSLCRLTNDIRIQNGIAPLAFSYTMEYLAQTHLDNLIMNKHDFLNQECNLHSWYPQTLIESKVNISNCCYPQDRCMTAKARELTVNWLKPYSGSAGENSFASMGSGFGGQVSPEWIMESWKSSPNHRSLLLSSTGVTCGAIINTTFSTNAIKNLALLWIGSQDDQIAVEYDGPPILASTDFGPTPMPTILPTPVPTVRPTIRPTVVTTPVPTIRPTVFTTPVPTIGTTMRPTVRPTISPTPTFPPTQNPTEFPTTMSSTEFPTQVPTQIPTESPTEVPTTMSSTEVPTTMPTEVPTTMSSTESPTEVPSPSPSTMSMSIPISTPVIVVATNQTGFVYSEGMYVATQVTVGLLIMCCLTVYIVNRYFVKVIPQIHPVPLERNLERAQEHNLSEDSVHRSLLEQLELEVELDPEIQAIHRRYQRKLRSARRQVEAKILKNLRKNYTNSNTNSKSHKHSDREELLKNDKESDEESEVSDEVLNETQPKSEIDTDTETETESESETETESESKTQPESNTEPNSETQTNSETENTKTNKNPIKIV